MNTVKALIFKNRQKTGGEAAETGGDRLIGFSAYFTAEAALVVPVVLCILVMIIYLSCYLYDRCILSQDLYRLSYRQSIEKGDADRAGAGEVRSESGNRLFMLSDLESDTSTGGTIRVRGTAKMTPPLFGLELFDREREWNLFAEGQARRTDPPRDYRKVRRILNLAQKALSTGDG